MELCTQHGKSATCGKHISTLHLNFAFPQCNAEHPTHSLPAGNAPSVCLTAWYSALNVQKQTHMSYWFAGHPNEYASMVSAVPKHWEEWCLRSSPATVLSQLKLGLDWKLISRLSSVPSVRVLDEGFDGNLEVVNQHSHLGVALIKRRVRNPQWAAAVWRVQAANLSGQLWRPSHTKPDRRELHSLQSQSETLSRVRIRLKSSHMFSDTKNLVPALTAKATRLRINWSPS